jgi:hypothetical protein
MKIEEIHTCEKSEGKIVCIEIDMLGNTYCAYCHSQVPYGKYFNELKKLRRENEI